MFLGFQVQMRAKLAGEIVFARLAAPPVHFVDGRYSTIGIDGGDGDRLGAGLQPRVSTSSKMPVVE
jgi:hypothetical protein